MRRRHWWIGAARPPRPACGERAGVRGALATARATRWWTGSCPSPGSRALRGFRPLPARGARRLAAAITYADFGNEVLAPPPGPSQGLACAVWRRRQLHLGLRIEHAKIAFGTSCGESGCRPNSTAARRNSGERIALGILDERAISKQTGDLRGRRRVDSSTAPRRMVEPQPLPKLRSI